MGRPPCCDKNNVKRGPWSPEEDAKLKSYIDQHGTGGNWIALPQKIGLKRCGKSCRLRWLNYLRPNIKHGGFSEEEDNIICRLYISIGSRWSIIAAQLPERTDNDIKNYWNTKLKKKLLGKQRKDQHQQGRRGKRSSCGALHNNMNMVSSSISANNHDYYSFNTNNWPAAATHDHQLPIPYSSQEQRGLNDHTSIRKLLINLGGKFSNDHVPDHHPVVPAHHNRLIAVPNNQSLDDLSFPHLQEVYHQYSTANIVSSSTTASPTDVVSGATTSQSDQNGMLFQGQNGSFAHHHHPQQQGLDHEVDMGLEFLLGDDHEYYRDNQRICLDEMRSMVDVYPATAAAAAAAVSSSSCGLGISQLQEYGLDHHELL